MFIPSKIKMQGKGFEPSNPLRDWITQTLINHRKNAHHSKNNHITYVSIYFLSPARLATSLPLHITKNYLIV